MTPAEAIGHLRYLADDERRRLVEPGTTPYIDALELAITALEGRMRAVESLFGRVLDELWELAELSKFLSPAPWSAYDERPLVLRDAHGRSVGGFALAGDAEGIVKLRNRLSGVLAGWTRPHDEGGAA